MLILHIHIHIHIFLYDTSEKVLEKCIRQSQCFSSCQKYQVVLLVFQADFGSQTTFTMTIPRDKGCLVISRVLRA